MMLRENKALQEFKQELIEETLIKQKEQLGDMFGKQKELDNRILNGDKYHYNEVLMALFVELGEFMNEIPTKFKYWKKSAKDDYEKALEEYVDCLHFAMSLAIVEEKGLYRCKEYCKCYDAVQSEYFSHKYRDDYFDMMIIILDAYGIVRVQKLFELGIVVGFTWDEIYNMYLKKNKINHKRQDDKY